MYHTRMFHSLAELDQTTWDELNTGQPFSQYRWLRFSEACKGEHLNLLIALLYDDDRLVGRAIYTIEDRATDVTIPRSVRRVVGALLARYPMLLCHSPMANRVGFLLPTTDETQSLKMIEQAIRDERDHTRTSFLVFGYLTEEQQKLIHQSTNYSILPMDPTTYLNVQWSTFDEYIASLSKSARKDYHQHTNHARKLNVTMEQSHQFSQYTDAAWSLSENVAARYGSALGYRKETFLEAERQLPDNSVMLLAKIEDRLVGCGLLVHDAGQLLLVTLGLDYTVKYVYFQLFYEAIRFAIDNKLQSIRGGSGAYEFKRSLGFQTEPTFVAFSSSNAIMRQLGQFLVRSFQENPANAP